MEIGFESFEKNKWTSITLGIELTEGYIKEKSRIWRQIIIQLLTHRNLTYLHSHYSVLGWVKIEHFYATPVKLISDNKSN